MKRLTIFSFYERDGRVGKYIDYLLGELRNVSERIIIVVNGELSEEGREIFKLYSDEIIIRENIGYDAGAYTDVLINYLGKKSISLYDEVILCNDTFYGPLVPLKRITEKMAGYEMWGLDIYHCGCMSHIPSYFLAFSGKSLSEGYLYEFFKELEIYEDDLVSIYGNFEQGIYVYFEKKCKVGAYSDSHRLGIYECAINCVERYNTPIIKKKAFNAEYSDYYKLRNMIKYVKERTNYNYKLILDDLYYRSLIDDNYSEVDSLDMDIFKDVYKANGVTYSEILKWIDEKPFYIYGYGLIARPLYFKYFKNANNFKGFIVSDKSSVQKLSSIKVPVYEYSECFYNEKIIVGVVPKTSKEIIEKLKGHNDYLYLWTE